MSATQAVARAVSILGHPMLVMPAAAWLVSRSSGAGASSSLAILCGLASLGLIVLGYSMIRVRRGHWQHVDASGTGERRELNRFLFVLFSVAAAVAVRLPVPGGLARAFALSAAIILLALFLARWCKLSLHVAFVAFAALVPGTAAALAAFGLLGVAVAWSRLALARHDWRDLAAGLLAGVCAGIVFHAL